MKLYCFDPGKHRNVLAGEYEPSTFTFIKKVKKNHYMIIEKSYGIQEEVLQRLKFLRCERIVIINKKKEIISLLEDWLKSPIKDYGHGRQRFIGGK